MYKEGDRLVCLKDQIIITSPPMHPDKDRPLTKGDEVIFDRYNTINDKLFYYKSSIHELNAIWAFVANFARIRNLSKETQSDPASTLDSVLVCTCDLWKGCTCGAMLLEKRIE